MEPFKAIIIAENQFEGSIVFKSNEEFHAYSEGLTTGANLYGAGGCGLYTLEDLEEVGEDSPRGKLIIEHLGTKPC